MQDRAPAVHAGGPCAPSNDESLPAWGAQPDERAATAATHRPARRRQAQVRDLRRETPLPAGVFTHQPKLRYPSPDHTVSSTRAWRCVAHDSGSSGLLGQPVHQHRDQLAHSAAAAVQRFFDQKLTRDGRMPTGAAVHVPHLGHGVYTRSNQPHCDAVTTLTESGAPSR